MSTAIILGYTVLCAVFGIVLFRSHAAVRRLETALTLASEVQATNESLLAQRSEMDTIKDEFISTVSHELRTPLTSIRGALGLLSAGLLGTVDGKAQNLLRIAVTNTDRLIRLINDILDLERMHSGRAALQTRRCSLRDLVQQSIETMMAMAEAADVKLVVTLNAPVESVFFDCDPDRILQVLTNLLSNAIKFSPKQGRVEVLIEADLDSVLLRVSDEGRGIPLDKLDAVFDRFQQVETEDARQKGGTGLGLAICRTIVQQHNGSIWAESNAQQNRGPGASLLVSLPRVSRSQDQTSVQPATMLTSSGEGTIVICDDDASIRTVVGEHLRQHGYQVVEADSGEKVLDLAATHRIGAILLDLCMPGLTGWQTLLQLKVSPLTAAIPVIVLSVLSPISASGNGSGAAASAQGWVQKPFNEHLLLAELSRVLHTGDHSPHVLLVEDNPDLAALVVASFKQTDVRIDHASTRQTAMQHCLLTPPDLLILDLTLPDGDGLELVEWLRQQPSLCTLPLVVYSGRDISPTERSQLQLGPTRFLTKARVQPHEMEELVLHLVHELRTPALQSVN